MCVGMCTGMSMDMLCIGMRMHTCERMCIHVQVWMCMDILTGIFKDMCMGKLVDM